ncbi:MAG: thiol reductant ABC exporter subunit CydD [Actinomycetales bacterium]|nr:thiol reductant ABC exporter subunit CydD [Actinomycetales bacterium]
MRPFDPRLMRYASAVRGLLVGSTASAVGHALLVIAQASLLTTLVSRVLIEHDGWADVAVTAYTLAVVIALRAGVQWLGDWLSVSASLRARGQLRSELTGAVGRLGPVAGGAWRPGELAVLGTNGVDALDGYFAKFLPQLGTAVAVPIATWSVIVATDGLSGLIIALTIPLVPFFMVLVGKHTEQATGAQWRSLGQLSGHLLDALSGLTTLRIFGRAAGHSHKVAELGEQHRRATTRVLRVTFLSAMVLELLATISIALVAVSIGLRLVKGHMDFADGFLVLLLAPEVYHPLRTLGAQYHAAADGAAAAQRIIAVLEQPLPASGSSTVPDVAGADIRVQGLSFRYTDSATEVLAEVDATFAAQALTVVTGPSGCGKSTLLNLLLKFAEPSSGSITVGGVPLTEVDTGWWRSQVAYVPQLPWLLQGTLRDAVAMARLDATDDEILEACRAAGLLADGASGSDLRLETPIGEGSSGVSLGQRRRIALARALLKDAPVVILDEPTASLDEAAEDAVVEAVLALRASGKTIIAVQHRSSLIDVADDEVCLVAEPVSR